MSGRRPREDHHRTKVALDLRTVNTSLVIRKPIIKILLLQDTKILLPQVIKILPHPFIKLHLPSTKIPLQFTKLHLIITNVLLLTAPMCSQITERLP